MSETSIVKPTVPSIKISSMDQQRVIRTDTNPRDGRQSARIPLRAQPGEIVASRPPLDVVMSGGGVRVSDPQARQPARRPLSRPELRAASRNQIRASDLSASVPVTGHVHSVPLADPVPPPAPALTIEEAQFCIYLLDRYLNETSPPPSDQVVKICRGATVNLNKLI